MKFEIAEGVRGFENIARIRTVLRRASGTPGGSRLRRDNCWSGFEIVEGLRRAYLQHPGGVNESFWGTHGVEEARQLLEGIWSCGEFR